MNEFIIWHSYTEAQYEHFRVFECQSEDSADNSEIVLESNVDYEGAAARITHSARSDKKKTPEFVGEIKTMIDNDSSKSMTGIYRDMGVSEFHIRQTVHEEIRYFSYKMCKGLQDSASYTYAGEPSHGCQTVSATTSP